MKLTKNLVSRDEAKRLAPDYVRFIESSGIEQFDAVLSAFNKLKPGETVLTSIRDNNRRVYVLATVTSMNYNDPRAVDGPVVRVTNGEYSWRVDGDGYAFPVSKNPVKTTDKPTQPVAVEKVLWGVQRGDPAWKEQIISTKPEDFEAAKDWAGKNGFHKFRIATIDVGTPPDFGATVNVAAMTHANLDKVSAVLNRKKGAKS